MRKRLPPKERREQILESAKEVFARKGLFGTRTRDIAENCGVNEALLYRYFKNKDDLFVEALISLHGDFERAWLKDIESAPNSLEGLRSTVRSLFTLFHSDRRLCANILHAIASTTHNERIQKVVTDWYKHQQKLWLNLIDNGVKDGSLRPDLVKDRALLFLRSAIWTGLLEVMLGVSENPQDQIRHVTYVIDEYWSNKPVEELRKSAEAGRILGIPGLD
jgi:AcrR family transcriptional regulator